MEGSLSVKEWRKIIHQTLEHVSESNKNGTLNPNVYSETPCILPEEFLHSKMGHFCYIFKGKFSSSADSLSWKPSQSAVSTKDGLVKRYFYCTDKSLKINRQVMWLVDDDSFRFVDYRINMSYVLDLTKTQFPMNCNLRPLLYNFQQKVQAAKAAKSRDSKPLRKQVVTRREQIRKALEQNTLVGQVDNYSDASADSFDSRKMEEENFSSSSVEDFRAWDSNSDSLFESLPQSPDMTGFASYEGPFMPQMQLNMDVLDSEWHSGSSYESMQSAPSMCMQQLPEAYYQPEMMVFPDPMMMMREPKAIKMFDNTEPMAENDYIKELYNGLSLPSNSPFDNGFGLPSY